MKTITLTKPNAAKVIVLIENIIMFEHCRILIRGYSIFGGAKWLVVREGWPEIIDQLQQVRPPRPG
jgi:hypothetical protein